MKTQKKEKTNITDKTVREYIDHKLLQREFNLLALAEHETRAEALLDVCQVIERDGSITEY